MDGGPSIGKPVVFDRPERFAVDSHVAILRPDGLTPAALAFLLASPLGQVQLDRAESGASGQTAVTEADLRRFRFPALEAEDLAQLTEQLSTARQLLNDAREELAAQEIGAWADFEAGLLGAAEAIK